MVKMAVLPNGSSLDSNENSSKRTERGGTKRPSNTQHHAFIKKDKRPAGEQTSNSSGRNEDERKEMKKKLSEEMIAHREKLIAHTERLRERVREMGEREMEEDDEEEERQQQIEDFLRSALAHCEGALGYEEEDDDDDDSVPLSIHFSAFPSLDEHVRQFAMERYYREGERGVVMDTPDLILIINKIRSIDPSVDFPSEKDTEAIDRLLATVNHEIVERVRGRRIGRMMKKIEKRARMNKESEEEMMMFMQNRNIGEEDTKMIEEQRQRITKEIRVSGKEEEGSSDIIYLDDEDENTEEDEDEMDDTENSEDAEEEDGDEDDLSVLSSEDHVQSDNDSLIEFLGEDKKEIRTKSKISGPSSVALLVGGCETVAAIPMAIKFVHNFNEKENCNEDEDLQVLTVIKGPVNMSNEKAREIEKWINNIGSNIEEGEEECENETETRAVDEEMNNLVDDDEWESVSEIGCKVRQSQNNDVIELD